MKLLELALKHLEDLRQLEEQLQTKLQAQEKDIADKTLRLSKSNGTFQYYSEIKNKRFYIRKKNIQQAKTLAQKDYDKKLIPYIAKNIASLEEFTKNYSPQKCINCFSKLPTARKLLVTPVFIDDNTYVKQWQTQKFELKSDTPEDNLFTPKNEHVRSKSEVIIASILKAKGVPYHYEFPVKISSSITFHPDFFCLNKRTRQEFYWEHCGRMDDPEYARGVVKRLSLYARKNIISGKNLILTMETHEHPLSTKDVEQLVETFLQ